MLAVKIVTVIIVTVVIATVVIGTVVILTVIIVTAVIVTVGESIRIAALSSAERDQVLIFCVSCLLSPLHWILLN